MFAHEWIFIVFYNTLSRTRIQFEDVGAPGVPHSVFPLPSHIIDFGHVFSYKLLFLVINSLIYRNPSFYFLLSAFARGKKGKKERKKKKEREKGKRKKKGKKRLHEQSSCSTVSLLQCRRSPRRCRFCSIFVEHFISRGFFARDEMLDTYKCPNYIYVRPELVCSPLWESVARVQQPAGRGNK